MKPLFSNPDRHSDFVCDHEIGIAKVNGIEVYYTELRIKKEEVPAGFFKYEVRSSDYGPEWATIEKWVGVNHCATILSEVEIPMENHEEYEVDGKKRVDDYTEIKTCEIIEDFWDED